MLADLAGEDSVDEECDAASDGQLALLPVQGSKEVGQDQERKDLGEGGGAGEVAVEEVRPGT